MKFFTLFFIFIGLACVQGSPNSVLNPFSKLFQNQIKKLDKFYPRPIANIPDREKLDKSNCDCRFPVQPNIVGGVDSGPVPWQASIVDDQGNFLCGGFVINNYKVMTAANCVKMRAKESIVVLVGKINIKNIGETEIYYVNRIFDDLFQNLDDGGDIAILKLDREIEFSNSIKPACLNLEKVKNYEGKSLIATGFGVTSRIISPKPEGSKYEISETLKKVYFYENKKYDNSKCKSFWICGDSRNNEDINSGKFGDSLCDGDGGNPLHHLHDIGRIATIEGVTSFGSSITNEDGTKTHCIGQSTFTRLSFYKNWIESIVGAEYCTKDDIRDTAN